MAFEFTKFLSLHQTLAITSKPRFRNCFHRMYRSESHLAIVKASAAQFWSALNSPPLLQVAVKTLRDGSMPAQVQDFQREIEVFSQLQHENVSCLKVNRV